MPNKPADLEGPVQHSNEVRDTIVKSGLSGVAATVLAVTIWSPAGLGGMVGTSMASGADSSGSAVDAVGRLAPFPAPITPEELSNIRARLQESAVALHQLQRATNDDIRHMRALAAHSNLLSIAPMGRRAQIGAGMDVTDTIGLRAAPAVAAAPQARESADVAAATAPNPLSVSYETPTAQLNSGAVVTYIGGDGYNSAPDPNMELASLLLAL